MTRPIRSVPTDGDVNKEGNLRARAVACPNCGKAETNHDCDFEMVDEDETMYVPAKSRRKLMPIELL